jgi:mannose-6-phosphate isomerase-like protein (cupin superfamily)
MSLLANDRAGITPVNQGLDGIVWNVLGQSYVPTQVTEASFAWHALLPIESFVPPHIHDTQDEHILVLDGALDLLLDGQRHFATAGDLVRMPRGIPHGIFNNAGRIASCLFWVTPTAKLFDLFKALHNVSDTRDVVRISAAHDVHFLAPKA